MNRVEISTRKKHAKRTIMYSDFSTIDRKYMYCKFIKKEGVINQSFREYLSLLINSSDCFILLEKINTINNNADINMPLCLV